MQRSVKRGLITAAAWAVLSTTAATAADTLTLAGLGGKVQDDLTATLFKPSAEKIGAELRTESHDGIAAVRVQVQSGAPGWDVAHLGAEDCAIGAAEGLFEPIDYSVVNRDGIPEGVRAKNWIATNTYSVVLAWRTDKYGDNPPKDWKDFWNVEKFPGRRALSVYPQEMMEIALLGDGVERDKVYPLDTKRSLAALEKIKPSVSVWWTSGAQSAQLLKDGEVDMEAIWGSRIAGVIADGAPVKFTYQDGVIGFGCVAILKGSKNVAAAQKLVANIVSPEMQARIPTMMGYYGPSNKKAFEATQFSADILAQSNASPENAAKQVTMQPTWWSENIQNVQEDFKNLIVQ
ncbi:extracellular solute-binding protein [Mesorhizobium sp. BAC0120]|uniref:ABC transporter substrate-binding protein n=1 Tax=Mesorhizobium sp. BAC0120 TaxID=3090670 RepID=UPI00298C6805|nr:extracellular solute-binding protein [Mesorhizobium sp. BAC0120]MDW6023285.1 extracellular solute-binding protein [Mesorhizobium sp. BAC0120]